MKIDCSFIVPFFNREHTLDRCLDSLVYQRTARSFEIILVDDQSTDGSLALARLWQSRFPDLIRILDNPDKGVAKAKNLAVRESRGEFVSFVDSDDYVAYSFLETMLSGDAAMASDIVVAPIWSVKGSAKSIMDVVPKGCKSPAKKDLLRASYFFLPGKMIRRELFDTFGPLPNLRISEDTSWMFPAIARASRPVVYVPVPGYYYEISENSISSSFHDRELVQNALTSSALILDNTPKAFAAETRDYVMRRILWYYIPKFKGFTHLFRDFLRARPDFCVSYCAATATTSPAACRRIDELLNGECDSPLIPKRVVCIAGTDGAETVFESEGEVCTIDPAILPPDAPQQVQEANRQGDAAFVAGWMALKEIFAAGGVYVAPSLEILHPFWQYRETKAFFAYATDTSFTDKVFGAIAGSEVVRLLLDTYESEAFTIADTLADRIRIVVTGFTNLANQASWQDRPAYGFSLCPVSAFVYSDGAGRKAALAIDRTPALESIRAFDRAEAMRTASASSAASAPASARERKLERERDWYRSQVAAMETSVVWRFKESVKKPLSKVGIFTPLKKCGNAILALARR